MLAKKRYDASKAETFDALQSLGEVSIYNFINAMGALMKTRHGESTHRCNCREVCAHSHVCLSTPHVVIFDAQAAWRRLRATSWSR